MPKNIFFINLHCDFPSSAHSGLDIPNVMPSWNLSILFPSLGSLSHKKVGFDSACYVTKGKGIRFQSYPKELDSNVRLYIEIQEKSFKQVDQDVIQSQAQDKPSQGWGWDTSTDFQVYHTTVYSTPKELPQYPNVRPTYGDEEEQRRLDALRTRMEKHNHVAPSPAPAHVEKLESDWQVDEEDVNEEAEEFIEMKRKKFTRRSMSMQAG